MVRNATNQLLLQNAKKLKSYEFYPQLSDIRKRAATL
jgi:ribosomal protein S21